MDRDFQQWGTAAFSDVRDMDVRVGNDLATAIFTVNFSMSSGPSLPLRLSTTWHKINGEWMLTQSASAIPPKVEARRSGQWSATRAARRWRSCPSCAAGRGSRT